MVTYYNKYRVEVLIEDRWQRDSHWASLTAARLTVRQLKRDCGKELRVRIVRVEIREQVIR